MVDPVTFGAARTASGNRHAIHASENRPAPAAASNAPVETANLQVSLIDAAKEIAKQGPPVDLYQVEQTRVAILAGNYQIDSQAIAEAMLAMRPAEDK